MQDLNATTEHRTIVVLALAVLIALLMPQIAAAQDEIFTRPDDVSADAATATEDPTPDPTPEETEEGLLEVLLPPAPEPRPTTAASPSATPTSGEGTVEAEGDAEEVAVAPVTPGDDADPAPGQPTADQAGVDGGVIEEGAVEEGAVDPDAVIDYGPQIVPSLGTASAPNTNEMANFSASAPLVMAPQIAGQEIAAGGPGSPAVTRGGQIADALTPLADVPVTSLTIAQPSWFATVLALVLLLAVAAYGATLRRRGELLPAAMDLSAAVRPRDVAAAGRSVRPADLGTTQARSVRP